MAKIAFYQNISYPNLGVMYLSAYLKKNGHETALFLKESKSNEDLVSESIRSFAPDIAAFSVTTGSHLWALKVAGLIKCRAEGVLTVMGGPHPTFYPEVIDDKRLDAVCLGEGERSFSEFVSSASSGLKNTAIDGFWIKKDGTVRKNDIACLTEDLDGIPFPDRALYSAKYPYLSFSHCAFISGRGCPYECTYCFNRTLKNLYRGKGAYVRSRTPANLIAEIEDAVKKYNPKTIYFQDDVFVLNRRFIDEFLPLYADKIRKPFICLSRIEHLDESSVGLLKRSGCRRIFWGLESGNEDIRKKILKRQISNAQIAEKAGLLKKHGIPFRTYNMLGIPGETLENGCETLDMNVRIKTDYPWCSVLMPYPRTEIADQYEAQTGRKIDLDSFAPTFFRSQSRPDHPEYSGMVNLQKLFYWAVKMPFIIPFVKLLVRLPQNIVYDLLFLVSYAYGMFRSEMLSVRDVVSVARYNYRNFFAGSD
ncbi:MAG: B12-binding domain-containing radical SAM protein [Endomicrobiales bacterium]|nr:B12-binding domain-containing radical SAM protein [Endomicrobiales bacterium]